MKFIGYYADMYNILKIHFRNPEKILYIYMMI